MTVYQSPNSITLYYENGTDDKEAIRHLLDESVDVDLSHLPPCNGFQIASENKHKFIIPLNASWIRTLDTVTCVNDVIGGDSFTVDEVKAGPEPISNQFGVIYRKNMFNNLIRMGRGSLTYHPKTKTVNLRLTHKSTKQGKMSKIWSILAS